MVYTHGEVSRFDPYQILGIEPGLDVGDIKKAYRKLSLKYHPDKNPGDKVAEEMFMKIAKAYEALTDEVARENYEKFGNPDGKQALEVSIGLPTAILENPKVVLVLYLIAMVIVIPVGVGLWYANSKQYGEKNIKYETYSLFYQLLTEGTRIKMMPEVLSTAVECRDLHQTDWPREEVTKFYGKLLASKQMQKAKIDHPTMLQTNLLLHAHVLRLDSDITPVMRKQLDSILQVSPELVEGMIAIAHQKRYLQTTIATIKFSQCLIQRLWHTDSSLLQLPHFTEAEVKGASRKGQVKFLRDYLNLPDEEKRGLAKVSDEERNDILVACNEIIPRLSVNYKLFVEEDEEEEEAPEEVNEDESNEDESLLKYKSVAAAAAAISGERIYEKDVVTLRVILTRENVPEGEVAPPVHAPYFPRPLRETWWVVLTDKPKADPRKKGSEPRANMYAVEKISKQDRVVQHEIRFGAPDKAGKYQLELNVYSGCYMGLDQTVEIEFEVFPATELPEYVPHPEDVQLDNEASLFEQMLVSNLDEEESSDEDESDDEDVASMTAAQRKRRQKKQAAKATDKAESDDGSDDGSEDED
eukprot:CAMPEP_0185040402 /NCGR_PEP_ID=MMETSP1103-20130426/38433_1 /TAXON_ID=36769 /ORGANISM="Paraphysomonas bandaiensis, Strain Caron Lab Isolate" /LENGTH=583 /DNA_ID=CAMNT_0027579695 /DNA_START=292 /DNA_END=2043 /DNA_ORIENTATION=+